MSTGTADKPVRTARPGRPTAIAEATVLQAAVRCLGNDRSLTSLSLREVAREADIAPNSIYRHFASTEDLAVAVIEQAGESLRRILSEARRQVGRSQSVVQMSTETFFAQLQADDPSLKILLREGRVGPSRLREAVDRQLNDFEKELQVDLLQLTAAQGAAVYRPALTARAITRMVFTMTAQALHADPAEYPRLIDETATMVRMLISGSQAMAQAQRPIETI